MRMLDLFSGIGGFHLAAQWVWGDDLEVVAHCEIEDFPQKVLKKHWPDVPIVPDIRNIKGKDFGTVDIITAGFPCQPFSVVGQKRGKDDERFLWPELLRTIKEIKPRWIIGENVVGIINMGFEQMLSELENTGYKTESFIIPACAVNAPHQRDRVWIIAYPDSIVWPAHIFKTKLDSKGLFQKPEEWELLFFHNHGANNVEFRKEDESRLCRNDDGIPTKLDESRLKSLGNAIVPQVAFEIMQSIKQVDETYIGK